MNSIFIYFSISAILSLISLIVIQIPLRVSNSTCDFYEEHKNLFSSISVALVINGLIRGLTSILYWSLYCAL